MSRNPRNLTSWFSNRRLQAHTRWNVEEGRARIDDPGGVIAGLSPLKRKAFGKPAKRGPVELLDAGSNIGRTVDLQGEPEFIDVLNLQSDDGKSRTVTIHTLESVDNITAPLAPIPVIGQLNWGSGGVRETIEFDWLNGQTFSIACSSVRLSARTTIAIPLPPPPPPILPALFVRVGAFAGYGTFGSGPRVNPQLTQRAVINAAASATFLVPKYTRDVWVLRTEVGIGPTVAPSFRVSQVGIASLTPQWLEVYATDENMERPVPVVNLGSGDRIRIENTDAVGGFFQLIFGMSL